MKLAFGLMLICFCVSDAHSANQPGQVQMKVPIPKSTKSVDPLQPGAAAPAAPVSEVFASDSTALGSLLTEEIVRGLRDPFSPPAELTKKETPKSELETIQLSELKLNGVITGPKKLRAMISAPGNRTYFVAIGDRLGIRQGRITAIQSDLVKVVEYEEDEKGRRVPEIFELRISGELVSLSNKEEE
jgi:hypothetical protein